MTCETDCQFGRSLEIARQVVFESPQNALTLDDVIDKTNELNVINRVHEEARKHCRGPRRDGACAVRKIIDGATFLIFHTTEVQIANELPEQANET